MRLGLMDEKRMVEMAFYIQKVKATNGKVGENVEGITREEEKEDTNKEAEKKKKNEKTEEEEESENGGECVASSAILKQEVSEQTDTKFDPTGEWKEDEGCPTGWLTRQGGRQEKCFKDIKSGKVFNSRLEAVRSLIRAGRMEEADLMKRGLKADGWQTNQNLPEGWMLKRHMDDNGKLKRTYYLTSKMEMASSVGGMIALIAKNPDQYSKSVVASFKAHNGMNWQEDKVLPKGWTFASVERPHASGTQRNLLTLMAPTGKFFCSTSQALKNCFETGAPLEEMEELKKFLVSREGWFVSKFLPPGWFCKKRKGHSFRFLGPTFDIVQSSVSMVVHLRQEGYGDEV